MPKKVPEMSAIEVGRKVDPGLYAVGGVPGLQLQVKSPTARSWILRVKVGKERRDIGLGGFPAVTLAQAREKARQKRDEIERGLDPVLVRRRQARAALIAAQASAITFDEAAQKLIDAKSDEWKNAKHRAQWVATLKQYASPVIGRMHVTDIRREHIMAVLEQRETPDGPTLWSAKTETASRLRGRLENVLDWATARGYRSGENPARWRGHLDKLLAKPEKIAKVEHHPALALEEVGAFMAELRTREGMAARALEFAILTGTRSGETRGALWSEIDLQNAVWTIPASRMAAYRRGDLFAKRARLMADWAAFCATVEHKGDVIPMHKARTA